MNAEPDNIQASLDNLFLKYYPAELADDIAKITGEEVKVEESLEGEYNEYQQKERLQA